MSSGGDDHGAHGARDTPESGSSPPDPASGSSRPHPFDRAWLHPSELPPVATADTGSTRSAKRRRDLAWLALAAASGGGATLLLLAATGSFEDSPRSLPTTGRVVANASSRATTEDIVDAIAPSVVEVRSIGPHGSVQGSGVALRRDGEVLTASDNIADPHSVIVVVDHRGDELRAVLLGEDVDSGLALLSVPATLRAATLSERQLEQGDEVLSIGAGDSANPWISEGITSATDVRVATPGGLASTHLVATDVQPGRRAAGGALVDRSGTVAAILLPPVAGDPTTYAVPIEYALEIAYDLRGSAGVARGWLGISGDDSSAGVLVTEVSPGGPAWRAGIEPGDVIASIDGRAVSKMLDLVAEVRDIAPGTLADLEVLEGGRLVPVEVTIGENSDGKQDPVVARPIALR